MTGSPNHGAGPWAPAPNWAAGLPPAGAGRPPAAPRLALLIVLWAGGAALLLVGTFLPWLRSGRVGRNSYELAGVAHRRFGGTLWVDLLTTGWPLLGPLWAIAVVLLVLRLRRGAAAVSALLALVAGGVAGIMLLMASGWTTRYFTVTWGGPALTLAGAVLVIAASGGLARRRSAPGHQLHESP